MEDINDSLQELSMLICGCDSQWGRIEKCLCGIAKREKAMKGAQEIIIRGYTRAGGQVPAQELIRPPWGEEII